MLYRETQGIENALTFAMPLFPVHAVRDLHKIRELLMEYRGRLQDMLAVLGGVSDPTTIYQAKLSVLDFDQVLQAFYSVRASSLFDEQSPTLPVATTLAEPDARRNQQNFTKNLVELFEAARNADVARHRRAAEHLRQ